MRNLMPAGVRAVVVPTLACALVCGGAVAAMAAVGVHAFSAGTSAAPAVEPGLVPRPPAAVVVRTPPPPPVTQAPTAAVWAVPFRG
jgi:hypothetical protein